MATDCTHDCSTCSASCESRAPMKEAQNAHSDVCHVIGVVSGKGGVGKSLVTSLLAVLAQRRGFSTGILDADLTGPSIPRMFGVTEKAGASELGLLPVKTKTGIELMSINLLLENETDPVVWRGPVIAATVKQFWTDVVWGTVDYLFVDMPPGTGDVPLTVFQSLPLDGIVIVTSPQELVSMIVAKAVTMAGMMDIPVLALVENMSYLSCPGCDEVLEPFGPSRAREAADRFGIGRVARLPIHPKLAGAGDKGMIELFEGDWLDELADGLFG